MEVDVADQLERVVKLLEGHPLGAISAVLIALLILGFQKDGLFSKWLSYLEARALKDTAKEERRFEIMRMIEERNQLELPGFGEKGEEETRT